MLVSLFLFVLVGFQFNFYFNQANQVPLTSVNYPPFMVDNDTCVLASSSSTTAPPLIAYLQTGCRLYYRSIKFNPADTSKLAALMEKGYTRAVKFVSTDFVFGATGVNQGTQIDQTITTSVVQPLRVWILMYPRFPITGAGSSGTNIAVQPVALARSDYASGVLTGRLQDCNIKINNIPYYRNQINSQGNYPQDWWERYKEQVDPQLGTAISYQEFLSIANYHCLDISRLSDRLQSPTQSVSLQVSGVRSDKNGLTHDVYYLIERMNQVTFRFSSSDVNMVVGNIEGS